ncbi:MAG: hypothetical protein KJ077_37255 [Anaerolineae bacterium]|nr:hypothetical protein [Anaerolineae bacterium]
MPYLFFRYTMLALFQPPNATSNRRPRNLDKTTNALRSPETVLRDGGGAAKNAF